MNEKNIYPFAGRGVVKIGGARGNCLLPLISDLASRVKKGEKWILVHGASGYMEELSSICGLDPLYVTSPGGFRSRFTGKLEKELFVYACNALSVRIMSLFSSVGLNAGLLYPEENPTAVAKRKNILKIVENGRKKLLRGNYSGTVISFDTSPVERLWEKGVLPVLPPLALDVESGEGINVDGDRLAAASAIHLGAQVMVILSNVSGLLKDPEDPGTLIKKAGLSDWDELEKYASGNMKRKLLASYEALKGGTPVVRICDSRTTYPLSGGLEGGGTELCQ